MPSTTLSKVATGVAGTTGISGIAVSVLAMIRVSQTHVVPGGMWAAAAGTGTVAALVASLGIILEYRLRRLQVAAQSKEAESAVALKRTRLDVLRSITDKAAEHPELAESYRDLIHASAAYLSVEQNGTRLAELLGNGNGTLPDAGGGSNAGDAMRTRRARPLGGIPQALVEAEAG